MASSAAWTLVWKDSTFSSWRSRIATSSRLRRDSEDFSLSKVRLASMASFAPVTTAERREQCGALFVEREFLRDRLFRSLHPPDEPTQRRVFLVQRKLINDVRHL